ncbi:MAG: secondary thiamine-phosphate synthase enzyme YjbQ [bacterium]
MAVVRSGFEVKSRGFTDVIDITGRVSDALSGSGLSDGIALVFVAGSTASVTSIEYESGAVSDLKRAMEEMAPEDGDYAHNERWHDGNGFSHVRAALSGSGFSVPFSDGRLVLGTWQQIVLLDHDNRSRGREVIVQMVGE